MIKMINLNYAAQYYFLRNILQEWGIKVLEKKKKHFLA